MKLNEAMHYDGLVLTSKWSTTNIFMGRYFMYSIFLSCAVLMYQELIYSFCKISTLKCYQKLAIYFSFQEVNTTMQMDLSNSVTMHQITK